jgi:hypothetical protein
MLLLAKKLETLFSVYCANEYFSLLAEVFVKKMKHHKHPFIVPYESSYREGKYVVVVMEGFEKGTLRECLDFLAERSLKLSEEVRLFILF